MTEHEFILLCQEFESNRAGDIRNFLISKTGLAVRISFISGHHYAQVGSDSFRLRPEWVHV